MPEAQRPDGASIHHEARGEGPLVVLAPWWSWVPGVYDELLDELAADHRVLAYHPRGTGRSSRTGPYDMETDAADLEAVLEEAGPAAAVICVANSVNVATRVAARSPRLAARVVCFGSAALPRSAYEGSESLVSSRTVIRAFFDQLSRDYRGAIRASLEATNPQMSREEVQRRVAALVANTPAEAALGRNAAWTEDEPLELSLGLGDRLTVLNSRAGAAEPWFPSQDELRDLTLRLLPEARVVSVPNGPVSAPAECAAAVREAVASIKSAL
jgi:pimeloyl-ACP methyl ester carboxylesterase